MAHTIVIQNTPLCTDTAMQAVCDPAYGAVDMFIGTVRNTHAGNTVVGITYDVHTALAKQLLYTICDEAVAQWTETKYFVAHYQGHLPVGGVSIIIAVASPHRAESFDACRYVIEAIKKRVPIWKNEHYTNGESGWLPGHCLRTEQGDG